METKFGVTTHTLDSDNSLEYLSESFYKYITPHGINILHKMGVSNTKTKFRVCLGKQLK